MIQTPEIKWLHAKWRQIEDQEGRRLQQNEFAERLGFSKNFMSMLLAGTRKLGLKSVIQIYDKTGDPTIFDASGYPERKPMSPLDWIKSRSTNDLIMISSIIDAWKREIEEKGIEMDSPESEAIIKELAARVKP